MWAVRVLTVCACAASVAADSVTADSVTADLVPADSGELSTVPDFTRALQKVKADAEAIKTYLSHEPMVVTDPRRHYIIIAGVLSVVADYLNSNCPPTDYDHIYMPVVDRLLPVVWNNPEVAVLKLEKFYNDSLAAITKVQQTQKYYCLKLPWHECNEILVVIAGNNTEMIKELDLILSLGELADLYETKQQLFERTAKNYEVAALLLLGKDDLKPLVFKASEIFNKLYGKRCYQKK